MPDLSQHRFLQSPLLVLAVSISGGILLGSRINFHSRSVLVFSASVVVGLVVLSLCLVRKRKLPGTPMLLVVAFVFTGLTLSLIANRNIAPNRISQMYEQEILVPNEPVELTGIVQGQPESAPEGFYLKVRAEAVRSRLGERAATGTVLLFANARDAQARNKYEAIELRHGARIRVMTVLNRDEDYRNPGVLPFTDYLDRKDFDATGVIKSPLLIERLDDAKGFLPLAWLYDWRERLEKQFDQRFSPETAGVLDAVLLGNRYKVSREVADRFRAGGTFHVLVIAGLHISFIAGAIFLLMRRLTRNRVGQFICAVLFLSAYSIVVGAQTPVMRAALVFTLGIFAPLVWRRANSLNVIAGAALALFVWRPGDLFDPSFQLTFLSVISIVMIAVPIMTRMQQVGSWRPTHETPYPPTSSRWFRVLSEALFWSERAWKAEIAASNVRYRLFKTRVAARLERWHLQRLFRFATAAMVVSASVQVGMLPVLIIYFHRVSFASLVLNIFVGAAMAVVAFTALFAIIVAQVSSSAATPLIWLAEKIEWLMVHAVDPFNRWGVASMRLPHYRGWAAAIYVLYFLALGLLCFGLARWNPLRPEAIVGEQKRFRLADTRIAPVAFGLLLSIILWHPFAAARPDGKLHVDFLDVGQGDCALVTMPDGATLMIDGGGRPNIDWTKPDDDNEPASFERDTRSIGEGVVSEYLWSLGLDRVDYILPTHADADHIDGLNDVARNFRVRGAIVARTPSDDHEYTRFAKTMKEASVPIERVGAGDVLHFDSVTVDVLWPPPTDATAAPWRNNDGTVMRMRYGNQVFMFTADIEKEAEAQILKEGTDLRSMIVKVPHHGSRTSSTEAFVEATRPGIAVISVGRASIFGHPHREVVERWRASGAKVMTTGESGKISVVTDGHVLFVSSFAKQ
jgi:competence protein ComEC